MSSNDSYVVIDDDICDIQTHINDFNIANTDWRYGLTTEVKERAIKILSGKKVNTPISCKCQLCYIENLKHNNNRK